MADLNDVWNWPNNRANGYATDTNDFPSDASFGISKRVDDIRTYTYKPHQTGSLHYTDNLSRTTSSINTGFAAHKHYFNSFGDDPNPTFNQFAKYPCVEWNIQPNGRTIGGIHYELNSNNMPRCRIQFTNAHNFANGQEIEFYGFAADSTGRDDKGFNTKRAYAKVIDGFNVELYQDSSLNFLEQIAEPGFVAQNDIFFTMLDDGTGSQDAVVHFDIFQETMVTGSTMVIADPFANLTGTLGSASSGTVVHLEKITGSNSFKLFTDSGRTTPFTITSGQGKDKFASPATGGIPFSISSSGSAASITVNLSDSSFASLRGNIESQNMTPDGFSEDETNIFRGFCRVEITAGTGTSKAIPTSMDDTAFFGYKYTKSTGALEILTDPTLVSRDGLPLTATNGSGNITGNIKIIDFWTFRNESPGTYGTGSGKVQNFVPASGTNVGGMFYFGDTNDTSLTPVTPLTHPLASETGTLYSGNKSNNDDNHNFDKLIYQLHSTNTRSTGRRKYTFQNSSNVTTNGAVYDFTKFWRPGATTHFTPTYITTPTATPDLSTQGFIDGTNQLDVFPQRGLFTLAGLGLTSSSNVLGDAILSGSPSKPSAHVIEKIGVFPINPKADEYVAPTAYAPDVFDTDDEWGSADFENNAKVWPKHVVPNNIKFTVNQPTSVANSQSGIKYARTSGVVKYQMEVNYPPMSASDWKQFEVIAQAAQGQSIPFLFDIRSYTNNAGTSTDLFYNDRTDSANTAITSNTGNQFRVKDKVTAGSKLVLFEGFQASQTRVFDRGDVLIGPKNGNGNLFFVVSDNPTSNKFGEVKVRLAYGPRSEMDGDQQFFRNPAHVRVTLGEDSFEFSRGADGFYRGSFRFDFDEYK
tara:strand:- start:4364 stop:6958 length:2595 start_codon:yes stop_codon:yes gene_type:complete